MAISTIISETAQISSLDRWLQDIREAVDAVLSQVFDRSEEVSNYPSWAEALEQTRQYTTRAGKRLRPALLLAGFSLGGDSHDIPAGLWQFAAGVEMLHTFMLIHDDVADGVETRRGGPALHHMFSPGKKGEDLAVVMGDYMFARSVETMLASGLQNANEVVWYYLQVGQQAAIGQYMDLDLARVPLSEVRLSKVLMVARLKTADPSFVAPLVAGGLLAGADRTVIETLAYIGRQTGLAFQLRDDLLGLFGEPEVAGKPCHSDLVQGKRTFPLIAAYLRAPQTVKRELEKLWSGGMNTNGSLQRAQALLDQYDGRKITQRIVARISQQASAALDRLPHNDKPLRWLLNELIAALTTRDY